MGTSSKFNVGDRVLVNNEYGEFKMVVESLDEGGGIWCALADDRKQGRAEYFEHELVADTLHAPATAS